MGYEADICDFGPKCRGSQAERVNLAVASRGPMRIRPRPRHRLGQAGKHLIQADPRAPEQDGDPRAHSRQIPQNQSFRATTQAN